ncbi:MAG TPA: hypothetical protein DGT21_23640 [Armatimonadetes bacterium]|jgi:hypothetical protein|nr:hypothetical protein [Armatimonadota bacterium]
MQTSQLRNFMAACNACDDPRLVQVWVMYQMSRSNDWRSMPAQPKDEKDMFGHRVVRLFAQPDGRIRQLANSLNDSAKPHRIELLQMQLLRAFAGQLARLHSYVEAKDGKKTISDWSMIEVLAKGADK